MVLCKLQMILLQECIVKYITKLSMKIYFNGKTLSQSFCNLIIETTVKIMQL